MTQQVIENFLNMPGSKFMEYCRGKTYGEIKALLDEIYEYWCQTKEIPK